MSSRRVRKLTMQARRKPPADDRVRQKDLSTGLEPVEKLGVEIV
jgi:hypothetical protein